MSGILRTNVQLLKCAPPVDIAMFPEAKDNMIAQDFVEYCLNINISKYIGRYQYVYFFCHKNEFKRPVDSDVLGQNYMLTAGRLGFVMLVKKSCFLSNWSLQIPFRLLAL